MHRILTLLLCFGSIASPVILLGSSSSSRSLLPGQFNIIGFNSDKTYVILEDNKFFKALNSTDSAILAGWQIGAPVRIIWQHKSHRYALVNMNTGETISVKHKSHLPEDSST
jgi:hypothetical protein